MLRLFSFLLLGVAISINYYFAATRTRVTMAASSDRTDFYLFGNPIQFSLSPAFHNTLFKALDMKNHSFALHESAAFSADPAVLALLNSPRFGGAAVTMPHKLDVLSLMHQVGPEVDEIGSMNTIVVLRDGNRLEGRNTDVLGIRNALLATLPPPERESEHPWGPGTSALIIGGGGTTRAAIYALSHMNLSPIYLVNRDRDETQAMIDSFPQYTLVALEDVSQWTEREAQHCQVVVGAIPSFEPVTAGEKNVYRIAEHVFELGAKAPGPTRRILEMAYKPHMTRIRQLAESYGWMTIGGIEALVNQALAQQKFWLTDPRAATYVPELAEAGMNDRVFALAAQEVRKKAGVPE
ncbi:uncharacterized protein JCM15063_006099 [Sporobolomyces koalae]|uniref:uncharacterized protein n=1 Tax=Sporobolomyces koalae TaxID=500713 RepID=UPI0031759D18